MDLQLQLLLTPVDLIVVRQQEFQRRLLLAGSTNCSDKKDGETTVKPARFIIMKSRNSWSSFMCLYKCFKMEIKSYISQKKAVDVFYFLPLLLYFEKQRNSVV